MNLGEHLIDRCSAETGLPKPRILNERKRTIDQIRMFADLLMKGHWVEARINERDIPLQKPDIRRMLQPIGPVAIFGASNFPLAFSTAGGDTISALAAGCPVVLKAHPSHPGTNEMISTDIQKAAQKTNMPDGIFSSLFLSKELAQHLVQHPAIKAVGFTGSRKTGMLLHNAIYQRPDPIPLYAEMSSVNPVVLLENAVGKNCGRIALDLAASITLGVGQFCTNPGLIILIDNNETETFLRLFSNALSKCLPGTMLNESIWNAYNADIKSLQNNSAVKLWAEGSENSDENLLQAKAFAFSITADEFLKNKEMSLAIFGPSTLFVLCPNKNLAEQVLFSLEGQFTASIHATAEDRPAALRMIRILTEKCGRIIYGGYPIGVQVCEAMQHGGPFPSTTDARSTSVGTAAINRFVRPVAYQDFPDEFLPDALRDSNPLKINRLVNGEWMMYAHTKN